MSTAGVQIGPNGVVVETMGVEVEADAKPCCCGGKNCCQQYTAVYDCFLSSWSGPTAGAKVCNTGASSWVATTRTIRYCTYQCCVAPGTPVSCTVDGDCSAITTTPPSLPAFPDIDVGDCCNPAGYPCGKCFPIGSCCSDYTVTLTTTDCNAGTYDMACDGDGHWDFAGGATGANDASLICHGIHWEIRVYDSAVIGCGIGVCVHVFWAFNTGADHCPPTTGWVYMGIGSGVPGVCPLTDPAPTISVTKGGTCP
jgi:hypothetical protein